MILRVSFMTLSQNVQHWSIKVVLVSPLVTSEWIVKVLLYFHWVSCCSIFFIFSVSSFQWFFTCLQTVFQRRLGTFLCCVNIDLPDESKKISFIKYISICRSSRSYIISMTYPKHTREPRHHKRRREIKREKKLFYLKTWVLKPIQLMRPSKKC